MGEGTAEMAYIFEVYYKPPTDSKKEAALTESVSKLGGRLDCREDPDGIGSICLTYEFDGLAQAEALRQQGMLVEGPVDYGE
jgi:hypothetical protein